MVNSRVASLKCVALGGSSAYGNTTKFYAPNGSLVGSATHSSDGQRR
jgi:hypothetical protein